MLLYLLIGRIFWSSIFVSYNVLLWLVWITSFLSLNRNYHTLWISKLFLFLFDGWERVLRPLRKEASYSCLIFIVFVFKNSEFSKILYASFLPCVLLLLLYLFQCLFHSFLISFSLPICLISFLTIFLSVTWYFFFYNCLFIFSQLKRPSEIMNQV